MHVIPDFRQPDNIRIGVCPLYTAFEDLHTVIMAMRQVVVDRIYEEYPSAVEGVT
jgi:kynureninase